MHKPPTILGVNVLLLITMVLMLTVGMALQYLDMWLGIMATEALLILLPALVYLWWTKRPIGATIRWRWPGIAPTAYAVVLGLGLAVTSIGLDGWMESLFGYRMALPPDFYPETPFRMLLCAVGLTVFPAICEEVLFRGVVQRGYERWGATSAVVISGLLFAFWHMRLQGLLPLLPVCFALGYVAWRSDSIIPGMAMHAAVNGLAAGILIGLVLRPEWGAALAPAPMFLAGIPIALAGAWLFHRATVDARPSAHETAPAPPPIPLSFGRSAAGAVPIAIAVIIYLVVALGEFAVGVYPELMARGSRIQVDVGNLEVPARWRYDVTTAAGVPVGDALISMERQEDQIVLSHVVAWNPAGNQQSTFPHELTTHWDAERGTLIRSEGTALSGDRPLTLSVDRDERALILRSTAENGEPTEISIPGHVLLPGEWPWRMSALPLSLLYAENIELLVPETLPPAVEETDLFESAADAPSSAAEVKSTHFIVRHVEPVAAPAGNFVAWMVTAGETERAWYSVATPHKLVRYENDSHIYLLSGYE